MCSMKMMAVVIVPVLWVLTAGGCAATRDISEMRRITVSGEGRVVAAPDRFRAVVSVKEWTQDLDQAQARVREASRRVTAAARAFPLDETKTRTLDFTVKPIYRPDFNSNTYEFKGYEVEQTFVFVITDVAKAEDLIVAVLKAGATGISNVQYRSTREKTLTAEATEAALMDARRRAEAMAAVLGQRLGVPLRIRADSQWSQRTHDDDADYDMDNSAWINPKDVSMNATVTVVFSLDSTR